MVKKIKSFINEKDQLINMFSGSREMSYEEAKWFGDPDYPGCKAMEAFMGDIENHLAEWACDGSSIYYRTEKYWYIFSLEEGVVVCERFLSGTTQCWKTWMNLHSCSVGKKWLGQPKQQAKLIPLYHTSN